LLSPRFVQQRFATIGRIRLGLPPEPGKKQPRKLPVFRLTSPSKAAIDNAAAQYGGTVNAWRHPSRGPQWEVITETSQIRVQIMRQPMELWFELWTGNETRVRRCNGDTEQHRGVPCLCDPKGVMARDDPRRLCSITARIAVLLADVPGIGAWRIESHGWGAADEWGTLADLINNHLPYGQLWDATLYLEQRSSNIIVPGPDGDKVRPRRWYTPCILIDQATIAELRAGQVDQDTGRQQLALPAGEATNGESEPGEMTDAEKAAILIRKIDAANTRTELDAIRQEAIESGFAHMRALTNAWSARARLVRSQEPVETPKDEPTDDESENIEPDESDGQEPDRLQVYTRIMAAAGRRQMTTEQVHNLIVQASGCPPTDADGWALLSIAQRLEQIQD
jgi:hypothetical protein